MAEEYNDPSGNTAQFQAFVTNPQQEAEPQKKSYGTLIAIVVVAVIVVGGLVWLAAS